LAGKARQVVYDLSYYEDWYEFNQDIWPEENYLWVEGYQASGGLKDTGLALSYLDPDGVDVCVNSVKITVMTVDLNIDGVADEAETTIGGFIALNNDDDDNNGTADKDANGPITGEDNLVKITLQKVEPTALTGTVTLKANSGGGNIKVWTSSTKGTEVTLPKTYSTPSELPKDLWVEGYSASTSVPRDVELGLEYVVEGQTFDDKVKFTVVDVGITQPVGSLDAAKNASSCFQMSAPYRFDFQGVISGSTGPYVLGVHGSISPSALGYKWTLDSATGTLTNDTTASPTHTAPSAESEGTLTLKAMFGTIDTGLKDEREVKIYKDHLARDYASFGTGGSCKSGWKVETFNVDPKPVMGAWNCHGSTWHHWNGSGTGLATTLPSLGTPKKTVVVTHQSGGGGTHPSLGTLNRGDIVVYYTAQPLLMHSQTCTGNGTETYGANNEPLSYPGMPVTNESWKWATSTAGDWANDLWLPGTGIMPVTIMVYDKP